MRYFGRLCLLCVTVTLAQQNAALAKAHGKAELEIYEQTLPISAVPGDVVKALKARFPDAAPETADVHHKRGTPFYVLSFDDHGVRTQVKMTPDAKLYEVARDVPEAKLPPTALAWAAERFPGETFRHAKEVERGTLRFYKVDVRSPREGKVKLLFDLGGHLMGVLPMGDAAGGPAD